MMQWFRLPLLAVLFVLPALAAAETSFTVAVPQLAEQPNLLSESDVLARLATPLLTGTLTSASSAGSKLVSPKISDSFSVSGDLRQWSFRIRPGATFGNGQQVHAADARFSVERCVANGGLAPVERVEAQSRKVEGGVEEWLEVTVSAPSSGAYRDLARELSRCPILHERSSLLFGQDLGLGTNLVPSGLYFISDLRPAKELTLELYDPGRAPADAPRKIILAAYPDPKTALSALRHGTFEVYAGAPAEIVELARHDETLNTLECSGVSLVYRRTVRFACDERLDLSGLRTLL